MSKDASDIIGLYDRKAAAWDDARRADRPAGEPRWIARFLSMVAPGARVLDIGCGSGVPIAGDILAAGYAVTGIDSSPNLIAIYQERFPGAQWAVADMRALDLGERFAGLIAWHSLFHLNPDDQTGMFGIFAAHAAPGAALIFTSGPRHGETVGCWQGERLYHASLDPGAYKALLAEHGFTLLAHAEEDPACGGATIWLARAATP